MSRIDVVYAANMKPGDLYAGRILPDAPSGVTKVRVMRAGRCQAAGPSPLILPLDLRKHQETEPR